MVGGVRLKKQYCLFTDEDLLHLRFPLLHMIETLIERGAPVRFVRERTMFDVYDINDLDIELNGFITQENLSDRTMRFSWEVQPGGREEHS